MQEVEFSRWSAVKCNKRRGSTRTRTYLAKAVEDIPASLRLLEDADIAKSGCVGDYIQVERAAVRQDCTRKGVSVLSGEEIVF